MKKKFTRSEGINGEMACRRLSQKARDFITGSDPVDVYETTETIFDENDDGCGEVKKYYIRGMMEYDDLSFEELEETLEDWYDDFFTEDDEQ